MLTGAGPTRAFVERVTHVVYLAAVNDDGTRLQVLPFADMEARLAGCRIHYSVITHKGNTWVSINVPFLPRNYVPSSLTNGTLYPLDAKTLEAARDEFVSWCTTHCVVR